jgi:hypothetical protein
MSAIVSSAISVHHIPPRVRDDREPPLQWDETARDMQLIWVGRESKYFFEGDWTGRNRLIASTKSRRRAHAACWTSTLPAMMRQPRHGVVAVKPETVA